MELTKEDFKNAFFDLAEEMEKECGEWWNEPDNPELRARILAAAEEHLKQEEEAINKGILISIPKHKTKLVTDIITLSAEQLKHLETFIKLLKTTKKEQE